MVRYRFSANHNKPKPAPKPIVKKPIPAQKQVKPSVIEDFEPNEKPIAINKIDGKIIEFYRFRL